MQTIEASTGRKGTSAMRNASRALAWAALWCTALAPATSGAAWEFSGTKSIAATFADGTRAVLGSVTFTPSATGSSGSARRGPA